MTLKGAFGMPGTKLSPDLEQIIRSPIVDKALDYAARKDRIGPFPIFRYFSEQFFHMMWHLDDTTWGPSGPWFWRRTRLHPELKYVSPKQLPEATREYLATLGISVPYHVRSIFFGRDDFGMGHYAGPPWSDLSRWQKTKVLLAAAWELPGYLKKVRNKVLFDAKKMKATDQARAYLREMARTKIEPAALAKTRKGIIPFVRSFEAVIVSGLEEKIHDGKSVADLLREGGCLIYQNHPSLMGLPINYHVFQKAGIDNVFTIAGNNLIKRMKDRAFAAELDDMLRKSGALFFERELAKSRSDAYSYYTLLEELIGDGLSNLTNYLVYSNGREKCTQSTDSRSATMGAARKARYLILAAHAHEIVPDAHELALAEKGKPPGTFEDLFAMIKSDGGETYHRMFVIFGKPIKTSDYFGQASGDRTQEENLKLIRKQIEADVSLSIRKLITFTSTYVLAEAIEQSNLRRFTIDEILGYASDIVKYADDNGLPLAPEFKSCGVRQAMLAAANVLRVGGIISRRRSGYEVSGQQEPLVKFYAAKIEPALNGDLHAKRSSNCRRMRH